MVRGLSDGFDDEAWVTQIARPYMYELCTELVWPIAIATLSGSSMLIRQTTDHRSPLAVEKCAPGFRVPILGSASGAAYLAWCPAEQREVLIELLSRIKESPDYPAFNRRKLDELLAKTREHGFAIWHRSRRVSDELSLAVPIMAGERMVAALSIRCSGTAVPEADAIKRFVPRLRTAAERISQAFLAHGAEHTSAVLPNQP
ncbi:MAG: hypothetical protein DYH20_04785 [Gammaproteobacteria bacterium PRO9]|nr:hypothetical protein [Gammaproteobacteria bacterium PRO9]